MNSLARWTTRFSRRALSTYVTALATKELGWGAGIKAVMEVGEDDVLVVVKDEDCKLGM